MEVSWFAIYVYSIALLRVGRELYNLQSRPGEKIGPDQNTLVSKRNGERWDHAFALNISGLKWHELLIHKSQC